LGQRGGYIMALKCKRCLLVGIGLVLSLAVLVAYSGTIYGEQFLGERTHFPAYYPEKFDGIGCIDRIARDEIVISDSLFRLSPWATYATSTRKTVPRTWLDVGNLVGFITNEKNEIISLWLLK
jgi:hypothetical protein